MLATVNLTSVPSALKYSLPQSIFACRTGRRKRRHGVRDLPVACYANHYMGYVVPASAYEEGGYEPGVSFLAPEAESIAKRAAIDLVKEVMS